MSQTRFISLILAILGVAAIAYMAKRKVPVTGAGGSVTATQSSGPAESPSAAAPRKPQVLTETEECLNAASAAASLDVREIQVQRLSRLGEGPLFFTQSPGCLKTNQELEIHGVAVSSDGKPFFREARGTVRVTKIEKVPVQDLAEHFAADETLANLGNRIETNLSKKASSDPSDRLAWVVTAKWLKLNKKRASYATPMAHPRARTVTVEEVRGLLAQGVQPVDVRPQEHIKTGALPDAIAVEPKTDYSRISDQVYGPGALKKAWKGDLQKLAKDKAFLVYANNAADYAAYNAISIFPMADAKIYWLRDGIDGWKNQKTEMPDSLPGVRTVDAWGAAALIPRGAVMVDARRTPQFDTRRILGAVNLTVKQDYDARGIAVRRNKDMTAQSLIAAGEVLFREKPPWPKDKPVVVYGNHEHDWRSAKVALLLVHAGYKQVYWLRDGLNSWLFARTFDPKTFPVYINPKAD